MTFLEKFEQASAGIMVAGITAVGSGVIWLVRRVFTNQKQIEMLMTEIAHRDKQRKEDRELLGETREDVREIRKALMNRGE